MAKNLTPGPRRRVPRTRGATSGLLLVILGAWGALIPFIGPSFNFSYTPDKSWQWTAARGWLEVAPGVAAVVGGLLLLFSASRSANLFGAWLGIIGGAWFVVGPTLAKPWHIGSPGTPAGTGTAIRTLETLALFTLLGVAIVYFAATAFGRLSVVSLRDARAAERREAAALEADRREREAAAAGAGVGAAAADAEARHDAKREERREERHEGRREAEAGAAGAGAGNGVNEPRAYDPNAPRQNAPAAPGHTADPGYQQPPAGYQQPGGYQQPPAGYQQPGGYQQPQPYQPQGAPVPGGATEQQEHGGRKHGLFHRN